MTVKIQSLNGLRGIAAINVVICHFVTAFLPEFLYKNYPELPKENNPSIFFEIFTSPLISITYNGHFAVLLFFVISGYVLSHSYFNDESSDFSVEILKGRLWGRYLRLNIPISIAILFSYLVYELDLYFNTYIHNANIINPFFNNYFKEKITFVTAIREASIDSIIFGISSFIPPLWTFRIEFIGSVFLLAYFLVKPRSDIFFSVSIVLLLIIVIFKSESVYFISLFAGALLNTCKIQGRLVYFLFGAGIYLGGFQFENRFYNFLPVFSNGEIYTSLDKTIYNAAGAVCLVLVVVNGFGKKFLESSIIKFLGEISFSIYLIHFIILCSASSFIYTLFPKTNVFVLLNFTIYIADCIFLSYLFMRFVDLPSIKLSKKFSNYILKK